MLRCRKNGRFHKAKKRKERPDEILPYAVELALYTGMRVGELSGLMWNDIDEVNKKGNQKGNQK